MSHEASAKAAAAVQNLGSLARVPIPSLTISNVGLVEIVIAEYSFASLSHAEGHERLD
jgi:hypothetical protein